MRRREVIALLGGAAASWPLAARAPRPGARRLAVLMIGAEGDDDSMPRLAALRRGLADAGWVEGENIRLELRWANGQPDLIGRYTREIVAMAPDAILANGTGVVAALKRLTSTIPIVCALVIDPVNLGLIDSLSRPGGNITGFTFIDVDLFGKWSALLKEAAPAATRAALLYNPKLNPWYANFQRELAAKPRATAIELVPAPVEKVDDFRPTIQALAGTPGTGIIIGPESFVVVHLREVTELIVANKLPGISVYRAFADDGGLMTYGPDVPDIFRRAAGYVDRVLRGANPAELPMQQPTKFQFVVNQGAARSLALTLPSTLLAGANDIID